MRRLLHHVPPPEANAVMASLVVAIVLLITKFAAYFVTGSAAIFSDALESIVNVVAASFGTYSLALAHRPADADHPYGHGKIEFLAAGFEGGMILLSAGVIAVQALNDLLHGSAISHLEIGVPLIAFAMLTNGLVGVTLMRTGRRQQSLTLQADGRHLFMDSISSAIVLIALIGVKWTGWTQIDPVAAVVVAVYIVVVGARLLREAAAGLMDEQDKADHLVIERILDSHLLTGDAEPRICSYHKLRHRHSGRYHWVDFHILLPGHWDIARSHQAASAIEYEIEQALGEADATAHIEPCQDPSCPGCNPAPATSVSAPGAPATGASATGASATGASATGATMPVIQD